MDFATTFSVKTGCERLVPNDDLLLKDSSVKGARAVKIWRIIGNYLIKYTLKMPGDG